jgi:hypothetical protein
MKVVLVVAKRAFPRVNVFGNANIYGGMTPEQIVRSFTEEQQATDKPPS